MENICYLVHVSTGCTCCAEDNFIEGPYRSKEKAQESADHHHRSKTLASQFARNGRQEILEVPYELAGGWIILDGKYTVKAPFLDDPDSGTVRDRLDMFERDWRL